MNPIQQIHRQRLCKQLVQDVLASKKTGSLLVNTSITAHHKEWHFLGQVLIWALDNFSSTTYDGTYMRKNLGKILQFEPQNNWYRGTYDYA